MIVNRFDYSRITGNQHLAILFENVLCIAERSRPEKQEAHRLEHFGEMSSVISLSAWINLVFIMICMSLAMLIRMMKKCRRCNEMSDELWIINIYEYKDCWLKRRYFITSSLK